MERRRKPPCLLLVGLSFGVRDGKVLKHLSHNILEFPVFQFSD